MNDLSFIIGGNFDNDRGNATAYATYRKIEPICREIATSACALSDDVTECYGSSTSPRAVSPISVRPMTSTTKWRATSLSLRKSLQLRCEELLPAT